MIGTGRLCFPRMAAVLSLPLALAAKGGGTTFQLVFPVDRPSPDQEIWVDLGEALSSDAGKPGPRIGFRKTRWSNPYS